MGPPEITPLTRRRRERPGAAHAVALGASLAVHALALALLARAGALGPQARAQPIALAPLSAGAWAANRAVRPPPPSEAPHVEAAPAPEAAPRAPSPTEAEPEGQVVAVAPSQDSRRPDRARFLADRDNRVERETRARVTGKFEVPAPRAISSAAGGGAVARGELGDAPESRAGAPGDRPAADAVAAAASREADAGAGAAPGASDARRRAALAALRASLGPGEDGARRAGPYDPRLQPTAASLGELAGGPSDDALDGVAEGDATALNTRGWRYAEFMNRVKREVSAAWDPETPLARHDPEGRLDRRGTWTTSLAVALDASGALVRIEVRRSCGREYLDAAAIEAFRRAQPFPNPPRGLVDAKGEIRFRFGLRYRPPGEPGLGAAAAAILGPAAPPAAGAGGP